MALSSYLSPVGGTSQRDQTHCGDPLVTQLPDPPSPALEAGPHQREPTWNAGDEASQQRPGSDGDRPGTYHPLVQSLLVNHTAA